VTSDAAGTDLDARNAEFWNMLCGSGMAQSVGMTGDEREDLRRFDLAYLDYYPYLRGYVDREPLAGKQVLEIGLGFGTLGQMLTESGADYHGVDIATEPVALMRKRLEFLSSPSSDNVLQASVLDLPFGAGSFDYVYSIGCLHHTGDLPRSIDEVHRVLRPRGRAVVMLYNRHSLRQLVQPLRALLSRDWRARFRENVRGLYDFDESGTAAPHVDFVSRAEARRLFARFAHVRIDVQNFAAYSVRGRVIEREWFLGNAARVLGLDLYIVATK
jgi:SAM-dependent methyltransferase